VASGEERRVEELVGRCIVAPDGSVVGRIEEMRAIREGGYFVVSEFHIGTRALLERIAVRHFGWAVPRRLHGYRARWDQVDLTDPLLPRLRCEARELKEIREAS
jgi:hypothetical protein